MINDSQKMRAAMLMGQAMDAAAMFGNYPEAIRLFTQAIQLDPNNGEIYHNRGMAYSFMQRWREALSDFSRAVALSPHPSSYEQRGTVNYKLGDRSAARRDWEQALRMDTRRTIPLVNLGWLSVEERRFREAIDYLSRAILAEPTNAKAYENRARAYFEMDDQPRGLADLRTARDLVASGRDTSDVDLMN